MRRLHLPESVLNLRVTTLLVVTALVTIGTGCSVAKVAGKATVATLSLTTDVTSATVRGTGKITYTAADVSFHLAKGGISAAAKLSKHGAVVFFDPRTGVVAELPWSKELTLLAAKQLAGVEGVSQAVRIIRAGRTIETARGAINPVLASGDVIELAAQASPAQMALRRARG